MVSMAEQEWRIARPISSRQVASVQAESYIANSLTYDMYNDVLNAFNFQCASHTSTLVFLLIIQ